MKGATMKNKNGEPSTTATGPGDDEVLAVVGRKLHDDDKSWERYQWESLQKTPERLEDAAKFLSGVISISLSLFLTLVKATTIELLSGGLGKAAMICWVLSIFACLLVIIPRTYRYSKESLQTYRKAHLKIVRYKLRLLYLSFILFSTALALVVIILFIL